MSILVVNEDFGQKSMHTTVDWGKGAITGDLAITTIMHYLLRRPGSYKISERSIANVSSSICILGLIVWPHLWSWMKLNWYRYILFRSIYFHINYVTHKMTKNCSLIYQFNTWKLQAQNIWRTCCAHKLFFCFCFDFQNNMIYSCSTNFLPMFWAWNFHALKW